MAEAVRPGDARSVGELVALTERGERIKYLFFWGHRPARDGSVGTGCLSQWWPSPFTVNGVEYATAEHWMMAGKARLFGDREALERILAAPHPRTAKTEGRKVRGFDEAVWARHRYELVVRGNKAKFGHHAELRDFLLGTGERVLVEASPTDRIWGIGMTAADESATEPAAWRGLNLLGFALMEVRSALRAEVRA